MVGLLRSVCCVVLLVCLGWGVVGCSSSRPPEKDRMGKGGMMDDKKDNKMSDDKMGKDKMADDKMGKDKMADDKMGPEKK
jgi:hypothetical protein